MTPTTEQERRDFISGYRGRIRAILILHSEGKIPIAQTLRLLRDCRERIEFYEKIPAC